MTHVGTPVVGSSTVTSACTAGSPASTLPACTEPNLLTAGALASARAVEPELRLEAAPEALLLGIGPQGALCLRLFDRHLWRGELSLQAGDRQRALEWFDALAQRSSESFAPTTLGL